MTAEQRDELFSIAGFDILESHYFPLIRFLIVDGLLDETYWYYKGNFNVDTSNILKRNDTIYMKGLKEGKALDIFLDVETPNEIINRLKLSDFNRFNILNKKVLKSCLKNTKTEQVIAIVNSVYENDHYKDLLKILDEFDLDIVRLYSNIMLEKNVDRLVSTLEFCEAENSGTFQNILISVLTHKTIKLEKLNLFKTYTEKNENIISLIPEEQFDIFIDNIRSAGMKFEDISEANCDKERMEAIEQIQAYKLNLKNLIFFTETILGKTIDYGNLLSEIYKSPQLSSTKNYIEDNFSTIIPNYIDENDSEKYYKNNEDILLQILLSDISEEYKLAYLERNEIVISSLNDLTDSSITTTILDCLLRKNKVKFCSDNIAVYWDMVEEYSDDFIKYLDNNLDENNNEGVLKNNATICNGLINEASVSDKIFAFLIKFANKPISNINHNLAQNRVNNLVDHRLIEVTEKNIEILLNNSYYGELTLLVNSNDKDVEENVINILLKNQLPDDLVYSLINSEISDENSLKLINLLNDRALVERIKATKKSVIKEIIQGDLSSENINYICNSFERFELKDEFIDSLYRNNKLEKLPNNILNENFMNYALKSQTISVDTKVLWIITKIDNNADVKTLKKYISSVFEISDLSSVWDRRQPLLDNEYKERVGQALIKSGYVIPRKYKDSQRIMLSTRLGNNTVDTHIL